LVAKVCFGRSEVAQTLRDKKTLKTEFGLFPCVFSS